MTTTKSYVNSNFPKLHKKQHTNLVYFKKMMPQKNVTTYQTSAAEGKPPVYAPEDTKSKNSKLRFEI